MTSSRCSSSWREVNDRLSILAKTETDSLMKRFQAQTETNLRIKGEASSERAAIREEQLNAKPSRFSQHASVFLRP